MTSKDYFDRAEKVRKEWREVYENESLFQTIALKTLDMVSDYKEAYKKQGQEIRNIIKTIVNNITNEDCEKGRFWISRVIEIELKQKLFKEER